MKLTPDRGGPRINEGIDTPNIQLIDATGHNVGVVAIAGLPPLGIFTSEFLLVTSTFARAPWLAVILVLGLLVGLAALFLRLGTIAFGVLSDVGGPPAQRTRTYLGALPVALVLVTIGTATARSTPAAVVGMLVVGFAVAFAGVGGPRIAGVANGLQLFYVLPCFPPYDPASLPQRLVGLVIGVGLVTAADRLLWPAGAPSPTSRPRARRGQKSR